MKHNGEIKNLTLGIFAHANAGKTTLTEHILFNAGVISHVGRVDTGNTITDAMSVEKERGISVKASLVRFEIDGRQVHLIDTPGHIDFSAEVERSISVLDGAVLVISGAEGVEPQTHIIWRALKRKNVPVIIFINKLDRLGASYKSTIRDIKLNLENKIISIIDICANEKELTYSRVNTEDMIEEISLVDDLTIEKYLEEDGDISPKWIDAQIDSLVQGCKLYPIIGGSALSGKGVKLLIESISRFIPSTKLSNSSSFSAFVYNVKMENNKTKYIYIKIISGSLCNRDIVERESGVKEKVTGIYKIFGSTLRPVGGGEVGDIVAITGINALCGELIGESAQKYNYYNFVKPILDMKVEAMRPEMSLKLVDALRILNTEDTHLNFRYEKRRGGAYVSLMGQMQVDILRGVLEERFEIQARFSEPVVIHMETPSVMGRGIASYTRFSGVEIEVSPGDIGSGLKFISKISTDFLHKKYQKQTERLIKKYTRQGMYGWNIVDAKISLIDGRFSSAGSDSSHFNIAVPIALMRALKKCGMLVLEPISNITIVSPTEYLSNILRSLSDKQAVFEVSEDCEGKCTVNGEVASSRILSFSTELLKITAGRGVFSSEIVRYDISKNQNIEREYYGSDPRNETVFLREDLGGSLDELGEFLEKKKRATKSKFKKNLQAIEIRKI